MADEHDAENENGDVDEPKKKSEIWRYFKIVDTDARTAKCRLCSKILSYRTTIANLKKHFNNIHLVDKVEMTKLSDAEDDQPMEEVSYLEDDIEDQDIVVDKRRLRRNGAWEYFDILDEAQKIATCTLCRDQFSYRTTSSNLAKHLRRRHCIEFEKASEGDALDGDGDSDERNATAVEDRRRSRTSAAWEYFTIKDAARRVATCKLCDSPCSYLTSVSNLMKHVKRKHGVVNDDEDTLDFDDDDDDDDDLVKQKRTNKSSLWLYFRCIDKTAKISKCLICKKKFSHLTSITNLKRHLCRKHPGVKLSAKDEKKMLFTSDGQLYEIDEADTKREQDHEEETEPMELNAIYLDDYQGKIIQTKRKKPRPRMSDVSQDSSDEEITFEKRYVRKKNDSLDQFGKYLVCLLKQLPKEVSNRLQADFVKQVMGEQLSCDAQDVTSNGYAIKITDRNESTEYLEENS